MTEPTCVYVLRELTKTRVRQKASHPALLQVKNGRQAETFRLHSSRARAKSSSHHKADRPFLVRPKVRVKGSLLSLDHPGWSVRGRSLRRPDSPRTLRGLSQDS